MRDKLGVIIQARVQSTRLRGKVVLPFYDDKTILDIIIHKVKSLNLDVILAIPDDKENDILVDKYRNVFVFRGSEKNVLERFIMAADNYQLDYIIRICADNPFVDVKLISDLLKNFKKNIDYISYKVNGVPAMKTHFGFFAELVSRNCLKKIRELSTLALYQEHVTNFIYENEHLFEIKWIQADEIISSNGSIRLTIDTLEDFKLCQVIYLENYPHVGYSDLIDYVQKSRKVQDKMKIEILKNLK